jgi:carbonic anhydrase
VIAELFDRNLRWAAGRTRIDPEYFRRLASQQGPEYLWIGCSDSRVPANEIVGLDPGELFVHRNVANLAPPQDANFLSVLQFAVEILKVRHIIVCGHYGCGGVRAAMDGNRHGIIDHWLQPIRDIADGCGDLLPDEDDGERRLDRMCELNVQSQVAGLARTPIIQSAWKRGRAITIHGWIYSLDDGLLRNLECSADGPGEAVKAGRCSCHLIDKGQ